MCCVSTHRHTTHNTTQTQTQTRAGDPLLRERALFDNIGRIFWTGVRWFITNDVFGGKASRNLVLPWLWFMEYLPCADTNWAHYPFRLNSFSSFFLGAPMLNMIAWFSSIYLTTDCTIQKLYSALQNEGFHLYMSYDLALWIGVFSCFVCRSRGMPSPLTLRPKEK